MGSNLGDIHWKTVTLRNGGGQQSVPDFLLDRFEYSYGFLGQVSAILIAWCIILWALGAFAMKKVRTRDWSAGWDCWVWFPVEVRAGPSIAGPASPVCGSVVAQCFT